MKVGAAHRLWSHPQLKILMILSYPTSEPFFEDQPENLIIACPNPPKSAVKQGKAIEVPFGEFSVDRIKKKLRFDPDIIQLSARDLTFKPKDLYLFSCPKVMKLGDSFYSGNGMLGEMINYCLEIKCDFYWTYQCVHHLHFFREAGVKNLLWFPPAIALSKMDFGEPLDIGRKLRIDKVLFRGARLGVHFYRNQVLQRLPESNIPCDFATASYEQCLTDYNQYLISLNCSANSDINRRIGEVVMAGGFLLTDKLSQYSGLSDYLVEGKHYDVYSDISDLIEKTKYYLANQKKAKEIAQQGYKTFREILDPEKLRSEFFEIITSGNIPNYRTPHHDNRYGKRNLLGQRIEVYELLQELHRVNESFTVSFSGGVFDETSNLFLEDLSDLPRISFDRPEKADVIVVDGESRSLNLKPGALLLTTKKENRPKGFDMEVLIVDPLSKKKLSSRSWLRALKRSGESSCVRIFTLSNSQILAAGLRRTIATKTRSIRQFLGVNQ
ncbi:MAG: glycosyltransferase [Bacteriovoracia bacterium]